MTPADEAAIRTLIEAQFAALNWKPGSEADWPMFEAGFLPGAQLVPAARPARTQVVATFVARMRRLASEAVLQSFSERPLAIHILGYGAVAVALAGCAITENDETITRDVSAFLLVRTEGDWRIAAQGWDAETEDNPLPAALLWEAGSKSAPSLRSVGNSADAIER